MRLVYFLTSVVLLLLSIFVCARTEKSPGHDKLGNIIVQPIDEAGLQGLISQRNGKILLLNFWATWCIPCREEMPDVQKIYETYQEKEVEVIGISVDYPDEVDSKILPFLKKNGITFPNYVKNSHDDEAFINLVDPEWSGALPFTVLVNPEGQIVAKHIGKGDFQIFQKMIEEVIPAKSQ